MTHRPYLLHMRTRERGVGGISCKTSMHSCLTNSASEHAAKGRRGERDVRGMRGGGTTGSPLLSEGRYLLAHDAITKLSDRPVPVAFRRSVSRPISMPRKSR